MRLRHSFLGVLALAPAIVVVPLAPDRGNAAPPPPRPVIRSVPLESRPDIAALFDTNVVGLRARAAESMSRTAVAHLGAITPTIAKQLGRTTYYRPTDIALYAVPVTGRTDEAGRSSSFSVLAVPLFAQVNPDGTVGPPPAPRTGLADPTFSSMWGDEDYFNWELTNVDDGGVLCPNTKGRVRGQWQWARLKNVSPTSAYDYWGVAQSAVAEITQYAKGCADTIDWFVNEMQLRGPKAYGASYAPRSMTEGSCSRINLSVSATFAGVGMSISQPVERCERWLVAGANATQASTWYGVRYDNNGVWNKPQRESASLQIARVPRGGVLGLNTKLDLDVDNR